MILLVCFFSKFNQFFSPTLLFMSIQSRALNNNFQFEVKALQILWEDCDTLWYHSLTVTSFKSFSADNSIDKRKWRVEGLPGGSSVSKTPAWRYKADTSQSRGRAPEHHTSPWWRRRTWWTASVWPASRTRSGRSSVATSLRRVWAEGEVPIGREILVTDLRYPHRDTTDQESL